VCADTAGSALRLVGKEGRLGTPHPSTPRRVRHVAWSIGDVAHSHRGRSNGAGVRGSRGGALASGHRMSQPPASRRAGLSRLKEVVRGPRDRSTPMRGRT
jgi:hypothetical protein